MNMPDLLLPALGIAVSPFGIVPAILLLFSPRPRGNSSAFLLGWIAGVAGGFLLGTAFADLFAAREAGPWFAPLRIVLGTVLVLLAFRQWRQRAHGGAPAWMAGLEEYNPARSARLGLILSLANPKVLLLATAGGLSMSGADATLLPMGIFAVVSSLFVAAPVAMHLVAPKRIMTPLQQARDWLVRHNSAIVATVLAVIGLKLLLAGLAALP